MASFITCVVGTGERDATTIHPEEVAGLAFLLQAYDALLDGCPADMLPPLRHAEAAIKRLVAIGSR